MFTSSVPIVAPYMWYCQVKAGDVHADKSTHVTDILASELDPAPEVSVNT